MSLADLVLYNAKVLTLDACRPDAQLVAIKNKKIVAVTGNQELKVLCGSGTKTIDCAGRAVLPGFVDAHCHIVASAKNLLVPNLEDSQIRSISDIQHRVRELARHVPKGGWIQLRGYHESRLSEGRHPTRWDLDNATMSHAVKLTHRSGRVHVLNSLALSLAGIGTESPDPPGGMIGRDTVTGEPNGVLYGMGTYFARVVPLFEDDVLEQGVKLVSQQFVSLGITSVHDASPNNNARRWRDWEGWKGRGTFVPRVRMMMGLNAFEDYSRHGSMPTQGDTQLSWSAIKVIIDRVRGEMNPPQAELNEEVLNIHRNGCQVAFHAIEEDDIQAACSAIEYALRKAPRRNHRHRIEHCSICRPATAKRLASLEAVVVTHPAFVYYNGERYLKTVPGKDLSYLYPTATLRRVGIRLAAGSDSPVISPNPLVGIYSAISRRTSEGNSISPKERLSPVHALEMYTCNGAYASFDEKTLGSIAPGKFADLVVLSGDPTSLPAEEVKNVSVNMTIIDGEIVWRSGL